MEIPVKDLNSAKKFYEKVFGWEVGITGEDYAFFRDTEDGIGGAFEISEKGMKGEFMLYISTENINNSLELIEKHGGKTLQAKTKISEEHGFFAKFEDIFGNVLGLWSRK